MFYHIITNCGRTITRKVKRLDDLSQHHMRHAMVGAATNDDEGRVVDIKDVLFSETETPPVSESSTSPLRP
jgi:hypothetical protein